MTTDQRITATMDRLHKTNDVEAIYYIGALDMLRDLWLDGGTAAEVATVKFDEMLEAWLDEWILDRSGES